MSRVDGSFRVYRGSEAVSRFSLVDVEAGQLYTADEPGCPDSRHRVVDGLSTATPASRGGS